MKLRLLALLLLCVPDCTAATLVVINNADSGAGSLRQAITDANITPGANFITFNIPGTGVQSIRSYSGVLQVTNPVTIDGTTQPGYAGMPLIVLDGAGRPGFLITAGNSTVRALVVMDCGTASVPASGIVLSSNGGNVIAGCFIGCDATGTNSGYQRKNYLHGIQIDNSPNNVIGGTNAADRNVIFGNGGSGIAISGAGATNNLVQGNFIGLNLAGAPGYPNGFASFNVPNVLITNAPRNTIGGVVAGARNAIAGYADGIKLTGLDATGNRIQGNYIGTAPDGSELPGGYNKYYCQGVRIDNAPSNTVGGTVSGAGNLISGNSDGITISGTNANANVVQGNFIGTDVSGTSTNANYLGIYISAGAGGNLIGGTVPGARNLISGNQSEGIYISGSSGNLVQGNFIGTDVSGTAALGNTPPGYLGSGVMIDAYLFPATNNLIGGASAGARNIISGNNDTGIEFGYGPSNNVVQGNFIGTDVTGNQALGNVNDGVLIGGALGTLIGGTNAGDGNVISANGGNGVDVQSGASGTVIQGNTIGLTFSSVLSAAKPAPLGKPRPLGGPLVFRLNGQNPVLDYYTDGIQVGPPIGFGSGFTGGNFIGVSDGGNGVAVVVGSGVTVSGGFYYLAGNTGTLINNAGDIQPSPIITTTTLKDGIVTVTGTDTGTAGDTVVVQVFVFDPLNNTWTLTGTTTSGIGPNGTGTFALSMPGVPGTDKVAVTATGLSGDTSQFSSISSIVTASGPPVFAYLTTANFPNCGWVDCPISTFTGELYEFLPADLDLGGPLPLVFQRYYAAFIQTDGLITGALGGNWLHNFEMTLTTTPSNTVNVVNNRGRLIQFTNSAGAFSLIGTPDIPFQLAANGGNYILGDPRSQMLYTFNSSGRLTTIGDGHGNAQTLSYTGSQLASVADGLGRTLTFQYSGSGFLTNVSDGTRSVGFVQTGNNLTSSADALGLVTTYSYDLTNSIPSLMTAMTLPAGNAPFTQTFDAQGRVLSQTAAGSNITTLAYANLVTTITDPFGRTNVHTHTATGEFSALTDETGLTLTLGNDANRRRTRVTDRLGQTTFIGYHAPSGKPAAITNADGTVTAFTYASRANSGITFYDLAQVSYPDGTSESFTYDASGNVLTHTDRAGKVFTFTYNARGQPLTAQNPLGGVTTFAYDASGRLASRMDMDTGLATFQYDSLNRLTNVIHPDSTALHRQFDANDRVLSVTDERGDTTTFNYDNDNRLIAAVDAAGKTNRLFFDGFNRVVRATDRLGNSTATSYDALDHVASVTNRNGNVTSFAYDTRQRLSAFTDPGGKAWSFGYDNEAIPASSTNPLGQTDSQRVNLLGYPVAFTNALGQVSSVARDAMERTTNAVDAINRTNGFGYDARGLLANTTAPLIGTATYQRNNLGLLSGITGLNGEQWNFAYTLMGRLQSLADPLNRTNIYGYDNRGRLQRIVFADGVTRSNSYDQASNPTRRQYSGGPDLQFSYDPLNRLTSANDLVHPRSSCLAAIRHTRPIPLEDRARSGASRIGNCALQFAIFYAEPLLARSSKGACGVRMQWSL